MALYRIHGHAPQVAPGAYVAAEATLIGRVTVGERASVWSGAVVRGDNEPIVIGERCNLQEGAVLHTDPGFPLTLGRDVSVGHQAMLHGCTVGDGTLVGIQAVVLNGAAIGRHCIVGAGAVVGEGEVFPDGVLLTGSPATIARELTKDELARLRQEAGDYVERAQRYKVTLEAHGTEARLAGAGRRRR